MSWVEATGGAIAGLIAGAFLSTLAIRWGRGDSVARGRSHCDGCGRTVPMLLLAPLIGYFATRGRCRSCGAAIDWRHPAIELACAAIGFLACGLYPGLDGVAGALFGWLLVTLALLDLDHFWLPDALTLPLAIFGLAFGLAGLAPAPADHAIGAVVGFLLLAVIGWAYRRLRGREGLGQGDAKLLGAIGAWLGWRALPWVLLAACAIGLGWCLVRMVRGRSVTLTDRLPLGALLACAAWLLWLLAPIAG
jgi:leader peptidase (prepilin peptidase)/N-methyltransferase